MNVFKTDEGKNIIRKAVKEQYAHCPVPTESIKLKSKEFGFTHVLTAGDSNAPALILLHGTSTNSSIWFPYFPQLIKHFRIYALDFPGQPGLSDEKRPPLEAGVYPRWLDETAVSLNIKEFHLAGFSMGGVFAIEYTISFPKKVKSLALICPGGLAPARPEFAPRIFPLLLFGKWGIRKITQIIGAKTPVSPEVESFAFLVSQHFIQVWASIPVFKDSELKQITPHLLLLAGTKDPLLNTVKGAKRLKTLIPKAEIHLIKDAGHIIIPNQESLLDSFFLKNQ